MGGANIGPFTASIFYANPLVWTNMSGITSITRANGQQITWTGGAAGSYVSITGSAGSGNVSANFTCMTPVSAGQFTVPAYVLSALPAASAGFGSLQVANVTTPHTFTAAGLNSGSVTAGVSFLINPNYQ